MTTTTQTGQRDPFDLIGLAALNLVWFTMLAVGVTVWWALLFPMFSVPLVLAGAAGLFWGPVAALVVVGVSAAGIIAWRIQRPEMFERWVAARARARFLTWFRYQRRWAKLMRACHLSIDRGDRTFIPRLLSADIGPVTDRVRVRMLDGHCPADFENRVLHLAHAFGALDCRGTITGPGTVELAFRRSDSLAETVILPRVDHWTKGGQAA
ncbi:hypothetical protein IU427_27440 [Nocardia beijingensis]|uniref:hypothetical protein n=1 Tax=Nocardia beijingensis TaxID=95162 RepID=UPI0018951137|nr:hypothetical protein [Nocardia beijingensis]MBF6468869.1 hypothetical protein [Nocardia beijingensis]